MKRTMQLWLALALVAGLGLYTAETVQAQKVKDVQNRGFLKCGVHPNRPGFTHMDEKGVWSGLDVDYCRAWAAALQVKVKFFPTSGRERFTVLQSNAIDVVARNSTWTMGRDTKQGVNFTIVNFYDGQGFMVHKRLGVKSLRELDGATICVSSGGTTELNVADYFRRHNMKYSALAFDSRDKQTAAYLEGRCDAHIGDRSSQAGRRVLFKKPEDHILLPEIISKEPLSPIVANGDDEWRDFIVWVMYALLIAEEKGVTQSNVEKVANTTDDPELKRMLGKSGKFGAGIGVDNQWALRAIKAVGNYAEIFDRNVGKDSPVKLSRGINALWRDGGLMYAPPVK